MKDSTASFFSPTNTLLFLPPMSISNAVCTWIATTLKSWNHLRLAEKTCSLCRAFPVYFSSFLQSGNDKHALLSAFSYTEYSFFCGIMLICFYEFPPAKWHLEARNFYYSTFYFEHLAQCVESQTLNKALRGS